MDMKQALRVFATTILSLAGLDKASAFGCSWYDLHCAAEDAGRNAAIEMAKGMDVATLKCTRTY